ncbi:hypothetical protein [Mucilaginibacter sp. FT3.2]|uniref:hypothetical protein n=1 Tax=Mucilaginibacter sp. FT3.2 TaxID=2723090 RepID=UPI00161E3FE2|nr:hypothetical protein [Mucilaginibacter sp. FT3.2]MBB6230268.1 hypothetical protein [Mucilaginibacter sp. FT3.2]
MKKALFLTVVLAATGLTSFAQNVVNPQVEVTESAASIITKIETDKQYTIVSLDQYATTDNAWLILNKEIYIQTDVDNKHYDYVKSENVAVAPETRYIFKKAGDKLSFKIYFKKIPANTKSIDIIERAGKRTDGVTFLNFYNVDLIHSSPGEQRVKVTDVVLLPPPPVNGPGQSLNGANDMASAMSSVVPMYASMAKSILDAQLAYYQQPGKIAEIAKLNKKYYDALLKEGFAMDQAIKIITSNSLIPKSTSVNGQ